MAVKSTPPETLRATHPFHCPVICQPVVWPAVLTGCTWQRCALAKMSWLHCAMSLQQTSAPMVCEQSGCVPLEQSVVVLCPVEVGSQKPANSVAQLRVVESVETIAATRETPPSL